MAHSDGGALLHEYFAEWIELYKKGAVRPVTYGKYEVTSKRLAQVAPGIKVGDLDKKKYQSILNKYAEDHERQTVLDFHRHVKSAIVDAVEEGMIKSDPTRRAVIKGKAPRPKKIKYLSRAELTALLEALKLGNEITWDWLILILAKTGMRFSEALGLTPGDFNLGRGTVSINKTWNYKTNDGFAHTKNKSSIRTVALDGKLVNDLSRVIVDLPSDEPIFAKQKVYNSTVNARLTALCKAAGVPVIALHALRHTHASILIYAGVSLASVAKRLGHSKTSTTQDTYLHIIREMEDKDNEKITAELSAL